MPTPNPTTRREYKGAAAGTTLQNSMSSTDTTFLLVAANNWPTGAVGKFVVTINRGQADEEKILCDSQSSRSVSCLLANRGFDGTTAQGHAAGATVECTISAFDADEWNAHTNATGAVHGVAGAVVGTTDSQTLTNKTLTAPTITGPTITGAVAITDAAGVEIGKVDGNASTPFIDFHSGATAADNDFRFIASGGDGSATGGVLKAQGGTFGIEGARAGAVPFYVRQTGSPSVDMAQFQNTGGTPLVKIDNAGNISATNLTSAWTTYTPTFTNCTSPTGSFAYRLQGKTLFLRGWLTGGTATGAGTITISLPATVSGVAVTQLVQAEVAAALQLWTVNGGSTPTVITSAAFTAGQALGAVFSAVIEVA